MGQMVATGFLSAFAGSRVLVTGHTGFKGSWLTFLLKEAGAEVLGYALPPEQATSHFTSLRLAQSIHHVEGDVRDVAKLTAAMREFQPEFVFHLAAQALVRLSYTDPQATFGTNVMGSVNLLEAVRHCESVRSLVYITSDKCYENQEWIWGSGKMIVSAVRIPTALPRRLPKSRFQPMPAHFFRIALNSARPAHAPAT
jgi:CDP-glucose 4,6-dehydratase